MAFRSLAPALTRFNSASSSYLLDAYDDAVDEEIISKGSETKHRCFVPSAFRCMRYSWFRIRGVEPDQVDRPDRSLQFTADMGTACHEMIQKRLSAKLGDDWIDVESYMKDNVSYSYSVTRKGYECLIEMTEPYPVRFACDGIVYMGGQLYLLEIKTSEFKSFSDLVEPKQQHIDQIKSYCALLGLDRALVLYVDRQYGGTKCFEIEVTYSDKASVFKKMDTVLAAVDAHIAPDGLPIGDPWCSSNMCPYYKKCKEWGGRQ